MIDFTDTAYKGDRFLTKPTNGKLDWYPYDTEEVFLENLKKYPNNKSLLHYKDKPLTYNLNSDWFRTPDEFTSKEEGNVYLGCSHTYGIGHYLENTWAYKVNQYVGGKFWNLSIPASGVQQAYITFLHYHSKLKIKNVFIYLPHKFRYTQYNGRLWDNIIASNLDSHLKSKSMSLQNVENYLSPEFAYMNYSGYLNAIENICSKNNYKMYLHTELPHPLSYKNEYLQARDLVHMAVRGQQIVADMFIDSVENNTSEKVEEIKLPTYKPHI